MERDYWLEHPPRLDELTALTDREWRVVVARWGLDGTGRKTLAETGDVAHMSRLQARATEARALTKLRVGRARYADNR